jgi:hypothetical protein
MTSDATTTDDQCSDDPPVAPRVVPTPRALRPAHAWLLLLGVYAAGFSDGVWGSVCTVLPFLHVASLGMALGLIGWQGYCWIAETVIGLLALAWVARPLARDPRPVGRLRPGHVSVLIRIAMAACVLLAVAVLYAPNWFLDSELNWRVVQMVVVCGLMTVIAARQGITRAELGLGAVRRVDIAGLRIFDVSVCGLLGASVCMAVLNALITSYSQGAPTAGGESTGFWVAAIVVNAIVEETVCTALLCVLLMRAARPRWQIYLTAGALRVAFHLYYGVGGLGAAVFAVVNARQFLKHRRLLPLIVAHAFFDSVGSLAPPLVTLALWVGALALAGLLARRRRHPAVA